MGLLSKPAKGSRRNIGGSRQRLKPSVTPLRTYGHPKPSARTGGWDERFDSSEIQRLYEADDYPLRKSG